MARWGGVRDSAIARLGRENLEAGALGGRTQADSFANSVNSRVALGQSAAAQAAGGEALTRVGDQMREASKLQNIIAQEQRQYDWDVLRSWAKAAKKAAKRGEYGGIDPSVEIAARRRSVPLAQAYHDAAKKARKAQKKYEGRWDRKILGELNKEAFFGLSWGDVASLIAAPFVGPAGAVGLQVFNGLAKRSSAKPSGLVTPGTGPLSNEAYNSLMFTGGPSSGMVPAGTGPLSNSSYNSFVEQQQASDPLRGLGLGIPGMGGVGPNDPGVWGRTVGGSAEDDDEARRRAMASSGGGRGLRAPVSAGAGAAMGGAGGRGLTPEVASAMAAYEQGLLGPDELARRVIAGRRAPA